MPAHERGIGGEPSAEPALEGEALQSLLHAARAPLSEWPARYPGRRPMGTLCRYVPAEIIHAAGLSPVRLRTGSRPLRRVDAHLQSFTCALCRSTLDQVLTGELDLLAGVVFAHTCDSMQALADLWRLNTGPSHWVHVVMHPAHLAAGAAHTYLVAELARFRKRLAALVGRPITDADLQASIRLFDETRRLVQALQARRHLFTAGQFHALLDAAQVVPGEQLNPLLARIAAGHGHPTVPSPGGPRLFLTGTLLDEPRVLDLIEGLGARVVGDNLCSGSRHFEGQVGSADDPLDALARYQLDLGHCPTKHNPADVPGMRLVEEARAAQAQGIVWIQAKFCEPHAFEYALSRPHLEESGLPHLVLEMEQTPSLEGLRTRLQAFLEML